LKFKYSYLTVFTTLLTMQRHSAVFPWLKCRFQHYEGSDSSREGLLRSGVTNTVFEMTRKLAISERHVGEMSDYFRERMMTFNKKWGWDSNHAWGLQDPNKRLLLQYGNGSDG